MNFLCSSSQNFTISGITNYFNYGVYGNLKLTNDNYDHLMNK